MGYDKPTKYELRQRRLETIMQKIFYQCWQNALKECNDNNIAFSRAVSDTMALYRSNSKDKRVLAICYHRMTMYHKVFLKEGGVRKYRLAINVLRYVRLIVQIKPSVAIAIKDYVADIKKYLEINYPDIDIGRYLK